MVRQTLAPGSPTRNRRRWFGRENVSQHDLAAGRLGRTSDRRPRQPVAWVAEV